MADRTPPPAAEPPPVGPAVGMWDDERRNPWRAALLYGLTIVATLLASHCAAMAGAA